MIAVIFDVLPHADLKHDYLDTASALRPHLESGALNTRQPPDRPR